MSYCQGNIQGCEADEVLCPICRDVMACSEHGHVDEGSHAECPHLRDESLPLEACQSLMASAVELQNPASVQQLDLFPHPKRRNVPFMRGSDSNTPSEER